MQVITGGKILTDKKILADIDRSSDGIIRLTQLDYSIEEFEKEHNKLAEKRKKFMDILYQIDGLQGRIVDAWGKGKDHLYNSLKRKCGKCRVEKYNLEKEVEQLEKALDKKKIKYREAYERKAARTETQIKKCETEKEALLKENLEPKAYERYRELEKTLDSLHFDLNEYNYKAHSSWRF